jgi:predicted DNA-binding transcriptional regulator AlpA
VIKTSDPLNQGVDQATTSQPPIAGWPIAVPASAAAALFGLSERAWWRAHSAGKVPLPIRIGRACRWRLDELEAWARAGAMPRDRWQEMKEAQ